MNFTFETATRYLTTLGYYFEVSDLGGGLWKRWTPNMESYSDLRESQIIELAAKIRRLAIIAKLAANDRNGVYTDADSIAEGHEPLTLEGAEAAHVAAFGVPYVTQDEIDNWSNQNPATPLQRIAAEGFTLDGGRIVGPGKFEGEPGYVFCFWSDANEGFYDDDKDGVYTFNLSPAHDYAIDFPTLADYAEIRLWEDSNGFVYHRLLTSDELAKLQADELDLSQRTLEYDVMSCFLPLIFNGDDSGLEPEDIAAFEQWSNAENLAEGHFSHDSSGDDYGHCDILGTWGETCRVQYILRVNPVTGKRLGE